MSLSRCGVKDGNRRDSSTSRRGGSERLHLPPPTEREPRSDHRRNHAADVMEVLPKGCQRRTDEIDLIYGEQLVEPPVVGNHSSEVNDPWRAGGVSPLMRWTLVNGVRSHV